MAFYKNLTGQKAVFSSKWFVSDPIEELFSRINKLETRVSNVEEVLVDQGDDINELSARVTALESGIILEGTFRFIRVDHCLQLQCLTSQTPNIWKVIAIWQCPEQIVDPLGVSYIQ